MLPLDKADITTIVALVAAIAPVTAAVVKGFELLLKWQTQRHEIALASAAQSHKITTEYLDRALNPDTAIGIRNQLLRFLAAPAKKGEDRLQVWASIELRSVQFVLAPFEKEIEAALAAVSKAKDEAALRAAEAKLRLAQSKHRDVLAPPPPAPLTPEAIRAGLFDMKQSGLEGLSLPGADLHGAPLNTARLMGADLHGANLKHASFLSADVRGANFEGADLTETVFYGADCRGASFVNAKLCHANFTRAHVERANFAGADLTGAEVGALYDAETVWPDGFDALAGGAVLVGAPAAGTEPKRDAKPSNVENAIVDDVGLDD
jgi:uncharacterized protein YjbI with pentapeptide repeats